MDYSRSPPVQYEFVLEPCVQIVDVAFASFAAFPQDLFLQNNLEGTEEDVFFETTNLWGPFYPEVQEDEYTLVDINFIQPNVGFPNDPDMDAVPTSTSGLPLSVSPPLHPTVESDDINMMHDNNNEVTAAPSPSPSVAKRNSAKTRKPETCTNVPPNPKSKRSGGHKDPLWKKKIEDADNEEDKKRIEKAIKCHNHREKEKQIIIELQLQKDELRKELDLSIEEEKLLEKNIALAYATHGVTDTEAVPSAPAPPVASESKEITKDSKLFRKDPPLYMTTVTKETPEKERQRIEKSIRSHEYREKIKETAKKLETECGELQRSLQDSKSKLEMLKKQLTHYQDQETAAAAS